jgi:hypothetical protein
MMKLDLRVAAALLSALALQTASALIWAGGASARLNELEARVQAQQPVAERIARLETQMTLAQQSLDRIERRLDRK